MRIADEGGRVAEVTSESLMEEQHQAREEYNNERTETRQTQMEQREDGTTLILTEARAESKEAFSSQSQDTRRFQHTETTVTGDETIPTSHPIPVLLLKPPLTVFMAYRRLVVCFSLLLPDD